MSSEKDRFSGQRVQDLFPMQDDSSNIAIAARVRGLIGGQDRGQLAATAVRLGVSERALRQTIDAERPYPRLDVLAAIVNAYAVDPTWLLSGEYDGGTHRIALAESAPTSPADLFRLRARRTTPLSSPVPAPFLRREA